MCIWIIVKKKHTRFSGYSGYLLLGSRSSQTQRPTIATRWIIIYFAHKPALWVGIARSHAYLYGKVGHCSGSWNHLKTYTQSGGWCWLLPDILARALDQKSTHFPSIWRLGLLTAWWLAFINTKCPSDTRQKRMACLWPNLGSYRASLLPNSIGGDRPNDFPRFKGKRHYPHHLMGG